MNSLRNLPIVLRYEEDGTILAQCPLLPDCQCKSTSRTQVLRTMQMLIKHALAASAASTSLKAQKYEVVHLAVAPASDSGNRFGTRSPRRKKPESPLLEVI
ncbi:hypothetical protein [Pendulispora albinea]|uniref:Uncharacterized protein n=1 Tax=Pendulispora albinea TaxID=2741071 RepID=A0ABZ2LMD3_9BACT